MNLFVRAVVYGFAFSLGAALYKRVEGQLGLANDKSSSDAEQAAASSSDGGDDGGSGGGAALTPA